MKNHLMFKVLIFLHSSQRVFSSLNDPKKILLQFEAKTKSDVCVLFAACGECNGYEFVIGGWDNKQSVIRQSKQYPYPGFAVTKVRR